MYNNNEKLTLSTTKMYPINHSWASEKNVRCSDTIAGCIPYTFRKHRPLILRPMRNSVTHLEQPSGERNVAQANSWNKKWNDQWLVPPGSQWIPRGSIVTIVCKGIYGIYVYSLIRGWSFPTCVSSFPSSSRTSTLMFVMIDKICHSPDSCCLHQSFLGYAEFWLKARLHLLQKHSRRLLRSKRYGFRFQPQGFSGRWRGHSCAFSIQF